MSVCIGSERSGVFQEWIRLSPLNWLVLGGLRSLCYLDTIIYLVEQLTFESEYPELSLSRSVNITITSIISRQMCRIRAFLKRLLCVHTYRPLPDKKQKHRKQQRPISPTSTPSTTTRRTLLACTAVYNYRRSHVVQFPTSSTPIHNHRRLLLSLLFLFLVILLSLLIPARG